MSDQPSDPPMEPMAGSTRWFETGPDPILNDPRGVAVLIVRVGIPSLGLRGASSFHQTGRQGDGAPRPSWSPSIRRSPSRSVPPRCFELRPTVARKPGRAVREMGRHPCRPEFDRCGGGSGATAATRAFDTGEVEQG
jgi:hypothetical protein